MISMERTRIHKGRGGSPENSWFESPSPEALMILIKCIMKTSDSVSSSAENCFSKRNTTRVDRRVSGNSGRSDRAFSKSGLRWCWRSKSNSEC